MPSLWRFHQNCTEDQQVDLDVSLSLASSSDSETSNDIDLSKCVNVMYKECDGVQGVLHLSRDAVKVGH